MPGCGENPSKCPENPRETKTTRFCCSYFSDFDSFSVPHFLLLKSFTRIYRKHSKLGMRTREAQARNGLAMAQQAPGGLGELPERG